MIKLQIIGHLGRDATVNNVNGKTVINFSVANSEKFKDAQGVEINKTTWVNCSLWAERTALVQYLKKGTQVYCEGMPDIHQYKSTSSGQMEANIRLRVQNIQLLGAAKKEEKQNNSTVSTEAADFTEPDDLPF